MVRTRSNFPLFRGVNIGVHRLTPRTVGLLLIFAAIALYAGGTYWIQARDYRLLYAPVPLAGGQNDYNFRVRHSGNYNLSILIWPDEPTQVQTEWFIRRNGQVVATGTSDFALGTYTFLGSARLGRGNYTLEFNVLTDARQLDRFGPSIDLNADDETYNSAKNFYESLVLVSVFLGLFGLVLVVLVRRRPLPEPHSAGSPVEPPERARRFAEFGRRGVGHPAYGYAAASALALLLVPVFFITQDFDITSKGIWVSVARPGARPQLADGVLPPIVIRVTNTKPCDPGIAAKAFSSYDDPYAACYFLNGKALPREELPGQVRLLLTTRASRTVYIQGDEDVDFGAVTRGIDIARQAYASRIVLLAGKDKPSDGAQPTD